MVVMDKLTEEQISDALKNFSGWVYSNGSIKKTFKTQNYPLTLAFVTAVGAICQRKNHHPDYMLVKFNEIEVSFSTHSAGGVTEKDTEIASELEKIPL